MMADFQKAFQAEDGGELDKLLQEAIAEKACFTCKNYIHATPQQWKWSYGVPECKLGRAPVETCEHYERGDDVLNV